jgi:hypothetical protein
LENLEAKLPVVGKTAEDIAARAETFRVLADTQLQQPDFAALNIVCRPRAENILAESYFALSEAYKRIRLQDSSLTEWVKAGALVAATVSVVNPLRPSGRADTIEWPYVNPAFALLCAYGHAHRIFTPQAFDERRRLYQALQSIRLPALDPIIAEGNSKNGIFSTNWNITLSAGEVSMLDALVTTFNLLGGAP